MRVGDKNIDRWILAAGAFAGLVLVVIDLFVLAPSQTSDEFAGVAATVNGASISLEEFAQILNGFEADTREAADAEDRARLLERLIEEELLIQRGLEIDMAAHDASVRSAMVQSMITFVTTETRAIEPTEEDLKDYFDNNQNLFTAAPQLHVRVYRGEHKTRDLAVPDGLLPATKLRDYLGPSALQIALAMEIGDAPTALQTISGPLTLELVDKQAQSVPTYESIKDQVVSAYLVHRDEVAFRDEIERLKKKAEIKRFEPRRK